jgi:hypothetical protein
VAYVALGVTDWLTALRPEDLPLVSHILLIGLGAELCLGPWPSAALASISTGVQGKLDLSSTASQ